MKSHLMGNPEHIHYSLVLIVALLYRLISNYCGILLDNPARPVYSHLFIYSSFLYRNSSSFEGITDENDVVAALMLTDQSEVVDDLQCRIRYGPTDLGFPEKMLPTKATTIVDLDDCRLKTVVLVCQIPPGFRYDVQRITVGNNRSSALVGGAITPVFTPLAQLTPKLADKTPRRLVICMSRVFAFEKWQLIVLAMEVYRQLKVDLVVAHVNSVIEPIFRLMKEYERDYILAVRPGIVDLPYWPDRMAYDPNTQTEFTGQLVMNHECFYEFRESAEFVALLDWDDLLISSTSAPLFQIFQHAGLLMPGASLFRVNSIPSTIIHQELGAGGRFAVDALVRDGVLSAHGYREEKLVVRPSRLLGYWMHRSDHNFDGYAEFSLTTDAAYCLHLGKETMSLEDRLEYNTKLLAGVLNMTEFKQRTEERLGRMLMSKALAAMPRDNDQPYYKAIVECSRKLRVYYKIETQMQCMAYDLCKMPKLDTPCIVASNDYSHRAVHYNGTSHALVAHQRVAAGFRWRRGCTV